MKKIFLFAAVVALSLSISAQKQMHVWVNGTETKYAISEVDSVTFSDSPIDENLNKDNGIGIFSIAEGMQVTFSKGNLQYTQSTNTWTFAENQWDYIGTDNVTSDDLADKIDLFGWSTNGVVRYGVSSSAHDDQYGGSFVDWGRKKIGADEPNTWRTLTNKEWAYILINRPNASSLVGIAQVNGVNGLIFLPDDWICPNDITFKPGFYERSGVEYYANYQIFTADQWRKLEAAGAVFLPAAGRRNGAYMDNLQKYSEYWSSAEVGGNAGYNIFRAITFYFSSSESKISDSPRYYGHSVRLVKDL